MKESYFFIAFIAATMCTSCIHMGERVNGSGNVTTENRQISSAEKIRVLGDMDVYLAQGPTAVKVEADDNIIPYIETIIEDNWLEIRTRDNVNIHSLKPVKVYVTTPEISGIKIAGSGNVKSDQKFSTDKNTSFEISGSGDVTTAINAPKVEAHISGSGNLHIAGETKDVEIHISGSGNYDGRELKAENANVSIAGSGDADLFVDNKLKASVTGSGNVKYKGSATVDSHISGSGSISKAE